MLTFYGYKKCSTSRKVESFLQNHNIEYKFVDITEKPPSASALKKIAKQANIAPGKLFNTSGKAYREGNYKEKIAELSPDQIFQELSSNGMLIKRPLVTDGEHSTAGNDEEGLKIFLNQ